MLIFSIGAMSVQAAPWAHPSRVDKDKDKDKDTPPNGIGAPNKLELNDGLARPKVSKTAAAWDGANTPRDEKDQKLAPTITLGRGLGNSRCEKPFAKHCRKECKGRTKKEKKRWKKRSKKKRKACKKECRDKCKEPASEPASESASEPLKLPDATCMPGTFKSDYNGEISSSTCTPSVYAWNLGYNYGSNEYCGESLYYGGLGDYYGSGPGAFVDYYGSCAMVVRSPEDQSPIQCTPGQEGDQGCQKLAQDNYINAEGSMCGPNEAGYSYFYEPGVGVTTFCVKCCCSGPRPGIPYCPGADV